MFTLCNNQKILINLSAYNEVLDLKELTLDILDHYIISVKLHLSVIFSALGEMVNSFLMKAFIYTPIRLRFRKINIVWILEEVHHRSDSLLYIKTVLVPCCFWQSNVAPQRYSRNEFIE